MSINGKSKPCIGPDGITYPSQAAAAQALGVSSVMIGKHLRKYGDLQNFYSRVSASELAGAYAALAKALNVKPAVIRYHIENYGHLKRMGQKVLLQPKPITIGGFDFPSVEEAQRELRAGRGTLNRWIAPDAPPQLKRRLELALLDYRVRNGLKP